jgi:GntR family transcriptional regulator, arabinose operon transcriptional repressor
MPSPRWKEIADTIQAQIDKGELVAGDGLPSETELASQWHVSRMTAHRALHELQRQGMVVRRPRIGTVVAAPQKRITGHVAVFLNTHDYLEQEFLAGIRAGLPETYDLIFCDIRADAAREAEYLRRMERKTDGILCLPTCDPANTPLFQRLLEKDMPIVCLDCVPEEISMGAVLSDNYGATLQALRFLTARGHRRIAHFTANRMSLSSLRERYAAYEQVMAEVGVETYQQWVRELPFELTRDPALVVQTVQDALLSMRHRPDPPTALFCANDYILAAVLRSCQELGLRIPQDLEIVSFNDCPPFVPLLPGSIHRIVQRAYEVGEIAARRLYRQMNGEVMAPEITRVSPDFCPATLPD